MYVIVMFYMLCISLTQFSCMIIKLQNKLLIHVVYVLFRKSTYLIEKHFDATTILVLPEELVRQECPLLMVMCGLY